MRQHNRSVDALYEMAMQRIGDLRCDAARGRDLKSPAAAPQDGRGGDPVVTTSSAICTQRATPTMSHQR